MTIAHQFEIRQSSAAARILFVFIVCLAVGMFSYRVARIAWAEEQIESLDRNHVSAALAADELNPKLHNWAGVLELYGDQLQPERAVQEFRRAVSLNPRVADYWANLGRACFITGDYVCAADAHERSVGAAPLNARYLNELAMYNLAAGNVKEALLRFHRLLEVEPAATASVITVCLRTISPELLWNAVVYDQVKMAARIQFFQILTEQGKDESAQHFWVEFVASRPTLSLQDAGSYLNILESKRNYSQLVRVWRDLEELQAAGMPSRTNLMVNSSFAQRPSDIGLDWHLRPEPFLDTQIVALDSGKALQLDFTAPHNAEDEPVYQLVPVAPNSKYKLTANVRSEEITSDSGPRLRVVDPKCPDCLSTATDGVTGTTVWHSVVSNFVTGPQTEVVRTSIWRPRSRSFPMDITGRFWVDSVKLSLTGPALPTTAQVADTQ